MYSVGDKIVYPMHGAGVIERIEEKNILDEIRRYYVLRISWGDIVIMLPTENVKEIGVRDVLTSEDMDSVLDVLKEETSDMSLNWNRRYRDNMDKLKSGDPKKVAEVARNLFRVDYIKKLSTGEKKLLNNAKQILLSELILSKGISTTEAERILENYILNTC